MSSSIRGNIASLLANLDDSDSDSDSGEGPKAGIYSSILSVTKQELKDTHKKLDLVESKIQTNNLNQAIFIYLKKKEKILKSTNKSKAKSKREVKSSNESNSESEGGCVTDSDPEVSAERKRLKSKEYFRLLIYL